MDEDLHNIDDLFKNALDDHEEPVPSGVWENIDKNLDKKKVISLSEKYKKLKWVAAALFIFSAGMAMFTLTNNLKNNHQVSDSSSRKKNIAPGNFIPVLPKTLRQKDSTTAATQIVVTKVDTSLNKNNVGKSIALNATSKVVNNLSPVNKNNFNSVSLVNATAKRTATSEEKSTGLNKNDNHNLSNSKIKTTVPSAVKRQAKNNSLSNDNKDYTMLTSKQKNVITHHKKHVNNDGVKLTPEVVEETDDITLTQPENANVKDGSILQAKSFLYVNTIKTTVTNKQITATELYAFQNNGLKSIPAKTANNLNDAAKIKTKKSANSLFKGSNSIGVFFSPDIVWSNIKNTPGNYREDDRNKIKQQESITNTYSFAVKIAHKFGRHIIVETGIGLSALTTTIQPKTLYARPDPNGNISYRFNCSAGYSFVDIHQATPPVAGDSIVALSSTNSLKYTSIPIIIKYAVGTGKFSITPAVGMAINLLSKGNIQTVIASPGGDVKENISHITGLNKSYLTTMLSVGINYNFSPLLSLNFNPVARIPLGSINTDAPVKTYLHSFGFETGLVFKL